MSTTEPLSTDLSEWEARELTAKISGVLVSLAELPLLLRQAHDRAAWKAMNYRSWGEYISCEFEGALSALSRERKREIHQELKALGGSTRDIAAVTGSSQPTVWRDTESTDSAESVNGHDGRTQPAHRASETYTPREPGPEVVDAEIVAESSDTPLAATLATLREAETHRVPARQEPQRRRRPITDAAADAGWEIRKAHERAMRVLADDRYPRNAEQVALALRGHLLFAVETAAAALEKLGNTTTTAPKG
jgi:hypothetical protein